MFWGCVESVCIGGREKCWAGGIQVCARVRVGTAASITTKMRSQDGHSIQDVGKVFFFLMALR